MAEFRIEGLTEFQEKLRLIERKAPDRIEDKLDDLGKKLRKKSRDNTPVSEQNKANSKRIKYGYRLLGNEKVRDSWQKGITNKAPHFHLAEKGHKQVSKNGEEIGRVPGLFFFEKSVAEFDGGFKGDLDNWIGNLYEELE